MCRTGRRDNGGRLAYLGGNGFYWKIAHAPQMPGIMEIRRAEGGIRAWAADAGEGYHQLDGGYGGLWRRVNRKLQSLYLHFSGVSVICYALLLNRGRTRKR